MLNIAALLFWFLIIALIVLFFISLTLYIARALGRDKQKQRDEIEKKLDRIIELLEQDKK
ncbi:DUF4083 family protein [Peribacillus sp. SCS-37]|uniref:DUF4083 family protein n=1 Tax=Paraperibacillus esterisolvens TaxID=3115296 RepID=UPI0039061592